MNENRDVAATTLAAIALVVAVIAAALGWMAYDRTGASLDKRIQDQVNQSAQGIRGAMQGGSSSTDDTTPSTNIGTTPDDTDSDTSNTNPETVPQTQP